MSCRQRPICRPQLFDGRSSADRVARHTESARRTVPVAHGRSQAGVAPCAGGLQCGALALVDGEGLDHRVFRGPAGRAAPAFVRRTTSGPRRPSIPHHRGRTRRSRRRPRIRRKVLSAASRFCSLRSRRPACCRYGPRGCAGKPRRVPRLVGLSGTICGSRGRISRPLPR